MPVARSVGAGSPTARVAEPQAASKAQAASATQALNQAVVAYSESAGTATGSGRGATIPAESHGSDGTDSGLAVRLPVAT